MNHFSEFNSIVKAIEPLETATKYLQQTMSVVFNNVRQAKLTNSVKLGETASTE